MSAAAAVPDPDDRPTGLRLKVITISLILAPLIQVFDTSLMSISLKQMQGSLSATQDQMAWVLTSYLIALAVMTPLWGAISGTFGRKRLLLIAIVGFMFCSLASGTSARGAQKEPATAARVAFLPFLEGEQVLSFTLSRSH